ncbi:hypothetical protein DBB36_02125 [Flavobacterium sp. WLB]|uniref:hypothetical protein n=1 Tax=unclassified Flavobacterium TaxID=196869 RepID=UPI0006ABA4E0|nr:MULTISPECIES: hypothetical protein [unclassified Flavobacterium]KOP39226.1 hypothetical protein AKO67_06695 [Flavobacterium sp. VMW]OWU89110.1 hypothetical protein APR43_18060 [Flavobacterium sp. NLM]PUU71677.1 hypothetical protein DBB36_02125 [Flavobacterium sp. WLB]
MSLLQNTVFGKSNYKINTYIGGIGSIINTPALLAAKLGIAANRIKLFRIINTDVECAITGGSYTLPALLFSTDTTVTYFNDKNGLVISSGYRIFRTAVNLKSVNFPSLTTLLDESFLGSGLEELILPKLTSWTGNYCGCRIMSYLKIFKAPLLENFVFNSSDEIFQHLPLLTNIVTPNLKKLGRTTGRDSAVWGGTTRPSNIKFIVNPFMQTSDSGNVEGDLLFLTTSGGTVSYEYNENIPNPVTTLSSDKKSNTSIEFKFNIPDNSNSIHYYELYVNGKYIYNIKNNKGTIIDLTPNTNYNINIVVVDIFYNKSILSNPLNVVTANYNYEDSIESTAYLNASGLSSPSDIESTKYIINQLISNSLWNEIHALYLFKGSSVTQHKWNAKNPVDSNEAFRLTFGGTGTYSSLGFQLNGSNAYANTYFNLLTLANKNNLGLTVVSGTSNIPSSIDAVEIGVSSNSNNLTRLALRNSKNLPVYTNISITGNVCSNTFTDAKGIFTGSKTSTNKTTAFRNGNLIGTNVTANASSTIYNGNIYIGCENNGNVPKLYSNQRLQMAIIHKGLSDSQVIKLHEIIDISESISGRKTW